MNLRAKLAERTGLEPVGVAILGQLWGIRPRITRTTATRIDNGAPNKPKRSTKRVNRYLEDLPPYTRRPEFWASLVLFALLLVGYCYFVEWAFT